MWPPDCLSASSPWSIRVSGTTSGATEEKGVEPHPFLQWTLSLGHLPEPYQEKEEAGGHQLKQQRPGKGCSMLISKSGVFSKDVAKCQCTCCDRRSVLPHQRAKEMSPQIILNKPALTLGCFVFHPANNYIFNKMLKAGLCPKRSSFYVLSSDLIGIKFVL